METSTNENLRYNGEKFKVSEPKDCQMEVKGKGLTAYITIHEVTGMYRESLDGWGTDQTNLESALNRACRRILEKSEKPSKKELCKGLGEFYDNLKGS